MSNPRKPVWQHKLEGSYRPHRHAKREGEMSLSCGTIGPPPACVAGNVVALEEWNRLVNSPRYLPVLAPVFSPLLTEYCMLTAQMLTDPEMALSLRQHRLRLTMELLLSPATASRQPWPEAVTATPNEFDDV